MTLTAGYAICWVTEVIFTYCYFVLDRGTLPSGVLNPPIYGKITMGRHVWYFPYSGHDNDKAISLLR